MDAEKQKDEIIALESIYNKEEFSYHEENGCYQCTFKIFINLPRGYHVIYKDTRYKEEEEQKVAISHLPPLSLYIVLPENYPSASPPKFTLCSSWLSRFSLSKVCKKLDKLWEENSGQEILFVWVAFLRDETLEFLDLRENVRLHYAYTYYKKVLEKAHNVQKNNFSENSGKECTGESTKGKNEKERKAKPGFSRKRGFANKHYDQRAIPDYPMGRNPVQALIDYNEKRNQVEFKKNFYTCKICFADKLGEHSTQFLPCSHVFCKDCISRYLEVRIKEGSVQNICCPEEKCTSEASPAQIKDLVSSELFTKYDNILLSATLDTMTDIVYCPRRNCQYPVSREPNEQMANCPVCQYAFCIYCKMVYHGIEPCKVSSVEKQQLVAEYQSASNEKKMQMENRYGKKQLQVLVENSMSENWIQTNSHRCPQCNAAIEKSDGCNKMVCWRCNTCFCWLCGAILRRDMPYGHFRNPASKCFNMLYHGLLPDEEDEEEVIHFEYEEEFIDFMYDQDEESENEEFYDLFM